MTVIRPRILVTGASGKIGGATLARLRVDPTLEVVAAVRTPEKAADIAAPTVSLDYDKVETLAPALEGVDRILMLTGYTIDMFAQSKAFINEARRSGVQHIVHVGACGDDDTQVAHWGWQQFVERYIEWTGFSFTHLRPDIFMQNLLSYGGLSPVENGVIRHYVGDARISWVDCDDVAEVAASCLRDPGAHNGKTYRLASDVASFSDIAESLTKSLGRPFRYEKRAPEEFLRKAVAAGADKAYIQSVYENYARYSAGQPPEPGADCVIMRSLLGRDGATWANFGAKHATSFPSP